MLSRGEDYARARARAPAPHRAAARRAVPPRPHAACGGPRARAGVGRRALAVRELAARPARRRARAPLAPGRDPSHAEAEAADSNSAHHVWRHITIFSGREGSSSGKGCNRRVRASSISPAFVMDSWAAGGFGRDGPAAVCLLDGQRAVEDLRACFALGDRDRVRAFDERGSDDRLGLAVSPSRRAPSFPGFVPDDIASILDEALAFVAGQVDAAPHGPLGYGTAARRQSQP